MSSNWKKVVIVGDGRCGKTSILHRYCNRLAPGEYEPTVFDNLAAQITVRSRARHITIWDTSGQEDWGAIRRLTYPDADLVFIAFDISNRDSLENASEVWAPEVRQFCQNVPIILVGNKMDLRQQGQGQVTPGAGSGKAREIGAVCYTECSALTGQGVEELFQLAAKYIFPKHSCLKCTVL